jgi:hypothetical protein
MKKKNNFIDKMKKKNNLVIIITVVVLLVIVIGVIVYFTVFHKNDKPKDKPKGNTLPKLRCHEYDTDFEYNDIGSEPIVLPNKTADDCQDLCQKTSECNFYTFDPDAKSCRLKTSDNGRINGCSYCDNRISGPKFCTIK